MSVLAVGISHHSAPVSLLEAVTVSEEARDELTSTLLASETVLEAMIVTTCNRVEVYASVAEFHAALDDIVAMLAGHSGMEIDELSRHLYIRYSHAAAEHLFSVASGLDSMVVGEQQIIGQIRSAYQAASDSGSAGTTLHRLAQRALHVGKRVHTETGIDSAGASVVSVALEQAAGILADSPRLRDSGDGGSDEGLAPLSGCRAVVVGAGAMGGLAVAHLGRAGASHIDVANRNPERAERLAEVARTAYTNAGAVPLDDISSAIADADLLFACTGAVGTTVSLADIHTAMTGRTTDAPLVICDLGLPRDVDPSVSGLPGVYLISIENLSEQPGTVAATGEAEAARGIVESELAEFVSAERMAEVGPLIGQLRGRGQQIITAELRRFDSRLPDLDDAVRDEVAATVRRVVDKVLHPPTVKFKQLAAQADGENYADVMRELFGLDDAAASDGRSGGAS